MEAEVQAVQSLGEAAVRSIGDKLNSAEFIDESSMAQLRKAYPSFRFTLCSEDDLGEREPYATYRDFDVHLLGHGTGCIGFTFDADNSRGIVVSMHEEP